MVIKVRASLLCLLVLSWLITFTLQVMLLFALPVYKLILRTACVQADHDSGLVSRLSFRALLSLTEAFPPQCSCSLLISSSSNPSPFYHPSPEDCYSTLVLTVPYERRCAPAFIRALADIWWLCEPQLGLWRVLESGERLPEHARTSEQPEAGSEPRAGPCTSWVGDSLRLIFSVNA
jgi:hypothetical protein